MKYRNVYPMILMFVFCIFFKNQNKADLPKESESKSESKDVINSTTKQSSASFFSVLEQRNGHLWFGGATNKVFKSTDGGQTWQDISKGLPANLRRDDFFADESGLYVRAGKGVYHNNPYTTPFWKQEIFPDNHKSIAPGKRGIFASNDDGQILQRLNGTSVWSPVYTNFQGKQVHIVFESDG